METHPADRLEQLAAEAVWLRRLARSLVADQAAADDLVQDTYIAAAVRPPPEDRPLRPWLVRVLTNLARMRGRSARRRLQRELRAMEDVSEPARPDQIVEHLETQRVLAGLVLELGDIYRDVVLLHYFEGLSSVEIGRRLGISDGTVRWRLKHALDELRAHLGGRDQRAWIAPMAGFAGRGALGMKKVLVVAALVALLLLSAFVAWRATRPTDTIEPVEVARTAPAVSPGAADVPRWVIQPEVAGRRIAGHVLRAGQPARGAVVTLHAAAQSDLVIAKIVVAADGAFDFGERPAADYHVVASAGAETSAAIVDVSTRDPRRTSDRLVLTIGDCAWRVVGTVTDGAATPIAHANVRLRGLVGVETDAQGRFVLCRPPSSQAVTVIAAADGYGTLVATTSMRGTERRDFVMVPEGVLLGRVVDEAGAAVAGAQVMLAQVDRARAPLAPSSTQSGNDGRFQIAGLAPGRITIVARAECGSSTDVETTIEAGTSKELLVKLHPTARVRGRVLAGGDPVDGAEVSASGANATTAWTQPDGSFVLDEVSPGIVTWRVRGYTVESPASSRVAGEAHVVLEVSRDASLFGVVTREGRPVADAVVGWEQGRQSLETVTDAEGRYELVGVPVGRVDVQAESLPLGAYANRADVEIASGSRQHLDLELDTYASVSGLVVDERAAPVAGAYVAMSMDGDHGAAMTDDAGHFVITALSGGLSYHVAVYPTGEGAKPYPPARGESLPRIEVANGQSVVTGIVLAVRTERGSIRGRVVDDTGAPISDARVKVADPRERASAIVTAAPGTVTDAAGRFALDGIVVGEAYLLATSADGGEAVVGPLVTGAKDVVVTVPRAGSIAVKTVGFGPKPRVIVSDRGSADRDRVIDGTDAVFAGLRAGTYAVSVAQGDGGDMRTAEVHPGQVARVELVNHGTGRLEAMLVKAGTRAPVTGAACSVGLADGWPAPADGGELYTSDAAGRVALEVPAGRVRITCVLPGSHWQTAAREIDVGATKPASTVLAFVPREPKGGGIPNFNVFPELMPLTVGDVFGTVVAAGLRSGDHILAIDGVALEELGSRGAITLLLRHAKGETMVLGVERRGVMLTIAIVVDG